MKGIDIVLHKNSTLSTDTKTTKESQKIYKRLRESISLGSIGTYNALADKNLAHYFSRPKLRSHLLKMRLIAKVRQKLSKSCIYRIVDANRERQVKLPKILVLPSKSCPPVYGLNYKKIRNRIVNSVDHPMLSEKLKERLNLRNVKVRSHIKNYVNKFMSPIRLPEASLNCIKEKNRSSVVRSRLLQEDEMNTNVVPIRQVRNVPKLVKTTSTDSSCLVRISKNGALNSVSAYELQELMRKFKTKSICNLSLSVNSSCN
eukprot:TRINITY_DN12823_c0_g8_i1.p1 TRINITY_DN12823_c0_g8~~TRINITY_DN12823_c0_g8_i1.p1  ORF type:complete len:259 (+),score=24.30 TRINITY_DN12823_c0_g8_i1:104-880(+)